MPDFRDYDDVIWASAASTLGLGLFDESGAPVAPRDGSRADVMRGQIAERDTVVRAPRTRGTDVCFVEVALPINLLLGLRWRYGGELTDLTPPILLHFSVDGLDRERARKFATRKARSAIELAIRGLGLVHAALDDTTVRISRFGSPDGPGFYLDTVRAAGDVARWMMESKRELGDSALEVELREELANAAAAFGVDAELERFRLAGSVGGTTITLELRAGATDHELVATLTGRGSSELVIETRSSRRGRTLHDLFRRHATRDQAFDKAFAVDADAETIARRCTDDVRADLLSLGARSLSYDARGLRVVLPLAPLLEDDPATGHTRLARVIERLRSLVLRLAGAVATSPYR